MLGADGDNDYAVNDHGATHTKRNTAGARSNGMIVESA